MHSNDQVAKVEAHWPDGFVDSMAPANGWAVVAHNGATSDATVTALDASGRCLKTITSGDGVTSQAPAECIPPPPAPPALPPAGAEQPDDADAARQPSPTPTRRCSRTAAILRRTRRSSKIPDSLKQAQETTRSNFPEAVDTVTVTVGDIVFTSKTEAALYFELKYTGGALFGQQIGYAKLIDGTWKISHDTMCMVLGWGGGMCDGGRDRHPAGPARAEGSPPSPPAAPLTTVPNN